MNSIKRNTIANYVGQVIIVGATFIATPFYIELLDAESYGLIGLFTLGQVWMNLLDLGISPTLGREIAYARGINNGFVQFKKLLRSFELIFMILSLSVIISISISSSWISHVWLQETSLDQKVISSSISSMGLLFGLRFFSSLYYSGLNGLEEQVQLNTIKICTTVFKFLGSVILLYYFNISIIVFFQYQVIIGLLEMLILGSTFYRKIPKTNLKLKLLYFNNSEVQRVLPFAISIGFTSGIWILISQTDKLILSSILSLEEFGYFSILTIITGGILTLTEPISRAIIPRMTLYLAQGELDKMKSLYSFASKIIALVSFSISMVIGLFSDKLIFAWTNNPVIAEFNRPLLIWYALGNGILALGAFQYYLQTAFGNLRFHVIGSIISALIQIPILYYSAIHFGAFGTGVSWFVFRLVWFLLWTPVIHTKFLPNFHLNWMMRDILPITIIVISLSIFSKNILNYHISNLDNRSLIFIVLVALGLFILLFTALLFKSLRVKIINLIWKNEN